MDGLSTPVPAPESFRNKIMIEDTPIIYAFKNMHVPLMIVGPDGIITQCNEASDRLFAYDGDSLKGQSVFDILPFKSVAELNALMKPPAINAVIKGMIGRNRKGKQILLAANVTVWTDAEHGLQHALALTDIGEDYLLSRASTNELQRANNAIKGARIGVFEFNAVDNSVIVSGIWREVTEIDAPDADILTAWRARVHPDDIDIARKSIRICLAGTSERAKCEYRFRAKDGSHWRWIHTDFSIAKRDKAGRVIRIIGATTDITERKEVESSLRQSQEQFRSAFEDSPVGKAIVALDGRYLKVNQALCSMFGYSEEEMLQITFQSITHEDDLADDIRQWGMLKANSIASYQTEKRYIRSNGAVMWGLLSTGVVRDADGNAEHSISQIIDVTDQRRLREMKSEFVATVSHELRTPLTSVLGSLALLSSMDDEPFSDEAQRLLYIAQENGKRLHALVNDILDFEKFSAKQMRFNLLPCQIVGLVEDAVLANLASADKYGVKLFISCGDRSLTAFVDAKRFQQVMTNLLSNSAKFAETGSTIDVAIIEQEEFVKISVSNDGDTIPAEFRDHIFKPFSQASSSTVPAKGGTGLGLNITKQIVEQTGGAIGFESEAGGRTTFWFTVPINKPT